jgi:plasmid maintenance system antidote protein VapI
VPEANLRKEQNIMASETSRLGQLLKGYLFLVGKTETDLANEMGLSRSRLSAAIHGTYRLKRDHIDSIVAAFTQWERPLTEESSVELLEAWQPVPERSLPPLDEKQRTAIRLLIQPNSFAGPLPNNIIGDWLPTSGEWWVPSRTPLKRSVQPEPDESHS